VPQCVLCSVSARRRISSWSLKHCNNVQGGENVINVRVQLSVDKFTPGLRHKIHLIIQSLYFPLTITYLCVEID